MSDRRSARGPGRNRSRSGGVRRVLPAGAGRFLAIVAIAAYPFAALPAAGPTGTGGTGGVHLICTRAGDTATVRYSSNWDLPGERRVSVSLVDADRCVLGRGTVVLPLSDGAAATVDLAGLHRDRRCAVRAPLTFTAHLGDPTARAAARTAPTCRLVLPAPPGGRGP